MPAFRYEAVDNGGATHKGVVNSDSARAARADLRVQGLTPLAVEVITAQVDEQGVAKRRGFGERLAKVGADAKSAGSPTSSPATCRWRTPTTGRRLQPSGTRRGWPSGRG